MSGSTARDHWLSRQHGAQRPEDILTGVFVCVTEAKPDRLTVVGGVGFRYAGYVGLAEQPALGTHSLELARLVNRHKAYSFTVTVNPRDYRSTVDLPVRKHVAPAGAALVLAMLQTPLRDERSAFRGRIAHELFGEGECVVEAATGFLLAKALRREHSLNLCSLTLCGENSPCGWAAGFAACTAIHPSEGFAERLWEEKHVHLKLTPKVLQEAHPTLSSLIPEREVLHAD